MSHDLLQALAIFAAGLAAGTINTVVGSGTLITFPTLLAFGYPPVLANVSNNVGLVPGTFSGAYGYRAELAGQRRRLLRLGSASLCGGLVGAILLLVLPAGAFKAIVPALIGVALVMVVFQPRLSKWVVARQRARGAAQGGDVAGASIADGPAVSDGPGVAGGRTAVGVVQPVRQEALPQVGGPFLWVLVFLSGVYGGYFGAAQGVLLLGLMGVAFTDRLQRINAVKNVLAGLVNGVAAVVFIIVTHVDWGAAGLIAAGAILGGQLGARIGKKLPPWGLRLLIICVGVAALVKLLAYLRVNISQRVKNRRLERLFFTSDEKFTRCEKFTGKLDGAEAGAAAVAPPAPTRGRRRGGPFLIIRPQSAYRKSALVLTLLA